MSANKKNKNIYGCGGCNKKFSTNDIRLYHEEICVIYNYKKSKRIDPDDDFEEYLTAEQISDVVLVITGLGKYSANTDKYESKYMIDSLTLRYEIFPHSLFQPLIKFIKNYNKQYYTYEELMRLVANTICLDIDTVKEIDSIAILCMKKYKRGRFSPLLTLIHTE